MAAGAVDPLLADAGRVELLLGNEAIARGALEAGLAFASGYPGTPASEILDALARIGPARGVAFEWAVNEKIALEICFAASIAGARSLCAMKHLGLMFAGDPLSTIPYVGTRAGMVIVSAGDPGCRTSPNEQDQRRLGPMLHVPVLDPATPAEAHAMTRLGLDVSESSGLPVLLRTTARVAHTRAAVRVGPVRAPRRGGFRRDPPRLVPVPQNARRMRVEIRDRMARAAAMLDEAALLRARGDGGGPLAILAAGAPAAACADWLRESGLDGHVRLITLGAVHPLPEDALCERLRGVERLLVVEELSPFLEDAVQALCGRRRIAVEILGQRSGHVPEMFEVDPAIIARAVHGAFRIGAPPAARSAAPGMDAPPRRPSLCPGCPHRSAYFAARAAFHDDQIFMNDIGCYTLGYGPPHDTADAVLCMGASLTLAAGVARVTGRRTVGFLGDSTFFHAGLPALLEAARQDANVVAVVLDNDVTAMTGFQPSPGGGGAVSIEAIARAIGARHVETVDPYDARATIAAFRRARDARGVAVVVVRRPCPVYEIRRRDRPAPALRFRVDADRCRACGRESAGLRCAQPPTTGFARHLGRAAALRGRDEGARLPSGAPGAREDGACVPAEAPCSARCPLGLCVEGYVGHVAAGEFAEAASFVLARTPLPESVCRVCHRPCEDACVRAEAAAGGPVAINGLKRFVVEWAAGREIGQPPRQAPSGKRVAVVGAGPSGLAAAGDLALRGHDVTIFDAAPEPGGLLARGVPAYRLPREALRRDVERVLALGVRFRGGMALGRDVTLPALLGDHDAVYLAIGAHVGRTLAPPGAGAEGAPPIVDALAFLCREAGTVARAPARVAVVGGGNAAIDAARTALRRGAARVTLACIEERALMPALRDEIAAALVEGVVLRDGVRPTALARGALVVEPVAGGASESIEADLVIAAIGQDPDLHALDAGGIALARAGGVLAADPETGRTSHPRVFAGGDLVTPGERTVTDAIAWGLRAAWAMDRDLRGADAAGLRPAPPLPPLAPPPPPRTAAPPRLRGDAAPRLRAPEADVAARVRGFDEVAGRMDEAAARAEAARCLACGLCGNCRACIDALGCPAIVDMGRHVAIDAALCIGCGVCVDVCPNGAIRAEAVA